MREPDMSEGKIRTETHDRIFRIVIDGKIVA